MKRKSVRPEDVTVKWVTKLVARSIGPTPAAWEGNCYAVACAIAPLVGGRPAYGLWHGEVSSAGYWANRAGQGFQRHGWVALPDGRILDPTRWSFEAVEPYIWLGENDDNYDEGGDHLRRAMRTPPPKDGDGPPRQCTLNVTPLCRARLNELLEREPARAHFYVTQLFWLACGPLDELGCYAREFFEALDSLGLKALVPIDHWHAVFATKGTRPCAYEGCKNMVPVDDVCYGCGGYVCEEHDCNMTLMGQHSVDEHWTVCEACGESPDCCRCGEEGD